MDPSSEPPKTVGQLEEARDQLLVLLKRSEDEAHACRAQAASLRKAAVLERNRVVARAKHDRESIKHRARLDRLAVEHRWQLSERALLAAIGSRDEAIRRLQEERAGLLTKIAQAQSGAVEPALDEALQLLQERGALEAALRDAERLQAEAQERSRAREEELQAQIEELTEKLRSKHEGSAAAEAAAFTQGAAEKLRADLLEDEVQELTRKLSEAESRLQAASEPPAADSSGPDVGANPQALELEERCKRSEAEVAHVQRENGRLEAMIEQLEQNLEAAVRDRKERTARLEDELHVVCTWANSIEQEYEQEYACLEQDYAALEKFVPEDVRRQIKQSATRGSFSSIRTSAEPSAASSANGTPDGDTKQAAASSCGLPPCSPAHPGSTAKRAPGRSASSESAKAEQQGPQSQGPAACLDSDVVHRAFSRRLASSSAPVTPRPEDLVPAGPAPRSARASSDAGVGRLDTMFSAIQRRAKQAKSIQEQLDAAVAKLGKAERALVEKDREIERLKQPLPAAAD